MARTASQPTRKPLIIRSRITAKSRHCSQGWCVDISLKKNAIRGTSPYGFKGGLCEGVAADFSFGAMLEKREEDCGEDVDDDRSSDM